MPFARNTSVEAYSDGTWYGGAVISDPCDSSGVLHYTVKVTGKKVEDSTGAYVWKPIEHKEMAFKETYMKLATKGPKAEWAA